MIPRAKDLFVVLITDFFKTFGVKILLGGAAILLLAAVVNLLKGVQ